MNKTILLTDENFEKQMRIIRELTRYNVIQDKTEFYNELKEYGNYRNNVHDINKLIMSYNAGNISKQKLLDEINNCESMNSRTYKQQFETLIDEVNSQNSYSKEVEEILKQLEV